MQKEFNNDQFLWESFKKGDEKAFFNIYDQHIDALLSYGLHFTNDINFLKDCIHDLFLDIYKYRTKLKPTDNVKFYLFKSLKRKIQRELSQKNILNQEANEETVPSITVPACDDEIIKTEIIQENAELLQSAMSKLTKSQQEALILKFEQELSYPEIADLLKISVESARTLVYRSLKSIRENIQKINSNILLLTILRFKILPRSQSAKTNLF